MPLQILAPAVVIGVSLIVLLIHFMGLSKRFNLADEAMAQNVFLTDYPDASVRECFVSTDHRAAVLLLEGGGLGLITALGADPVCRAYSSENRPEIVVTGSVLRFEVGEFGLEDIEIHLSDAQACQIVTG